MAKLTVTINTNNHTTSPPTHLSSYTTTTTSPTCPPTQRPRSLGGATGAVGFTSDAQAQAFADTIWDLFLGGASPDRPFGAAVLDGCVSVFTSYFFVFVFLCL